MAANIVNNGLLNLEILLDDLDLVMVDRGGFSTAETNLAQTAGAI